MAIENEAIAFVPLELPTGAVSYNLGEDWFSLEDSLELGFGMGDCNGNDIEIRIDADTRLNLAPTDSIAFWAYARRDKPDPEDVSLADLNAANPTTYSLEQADTL